MNNKSTLGRIYEKFCSTSPDQYHNDEIDATYQDIADYFDNPEGDINQHYAGGHGYDLLNKLIFSQSDDHTILQRETPTPERPSYLNSIRYNNIEECKDSLENQVLSYMNQPTRQTANEALNIQNNQPEP